MKAVAINGSPRKGGNTEILLRKALAPLAAAGWETQFIQLGGTPIRGCRACYQCFEVNMTDLGQTIAWLGEAIQQHGAARPVAEVRE